MADKPYIPRSGFAAQPDSNSNDRLADHIGQGVGETGTLGIKLTQKLVIQPIRKGIADYKIQRAQRQADQAKAAKETAEKLAEEARRAEALKKAEAEKAKTQQTVSQNPSGSPTPSGPGPATPSPAATQKRTPDGRVRMPVAMRDPVTGETVMGEMTYDVYKDASAPGAQASTRKTRFAGEHEAQELADKQRATSRAAQVEEPDFSSDEKDTAKDKTSTQRIAAMLFGRKEDDPLAKKKKHLDNHKRHSLRHRLAKFVKRVGEVLGVKRNKHGVKTGEKPVKLTEGVRAEAHLDRLTKASGGKPFSSAASVGEAEKSIATLGKAASASKGFAGLGQLRGLGVKGGIASFFAIPIAAGVATYATAAEKQSGWKTTKEVASVTGKLAWEQIKGIPAGIESIGKWIDLYDKDSKAAKKQFFDGVSEALDTSREVVQAAIADPAAAHDALVNMGSVTREEVTKDVAADKGAPAPAAAAKPMEEPVAQIAPQPHASNLGSLRSIDAPIAAVAAVAPTKAPLFRPRRNLGDTRSRLQTPIASSPSPATKRHESVAMGGPRDAGIMTPGWSA